MYNYLQPDGTSLYGNYRTRTFTQIFPDAETFAAQWEATPFAKILDDSLPNEVLYFLLYARYGNSHIASSDENQFKYKLFSIIFQYGPTWQKELTIQQELRIANFDDFRQGTTNIVNNANNPSVEPTTQSLNELPYINQQNVSKVTRSKADGYALLLSLLKKDVTEDFIKRFQYLFLIIVEPEKPLWYADYNTED